MERRRSYKGESALPSPELSALLAAGALGEPGLALDLGCGIGSEALLLAAQGWEAWGIDSDELALRVARRRATRFGLPARFERLELPGRLPLADASCALLLDRLLWNNLEARQLTPLVRELARVAAPGGRFLLRVKEADGLRTREAFEPPAPEMIAPKRALGALLEAFEPQGPPVRIALSGDREIVHGVVALLLRR